MKESKRYTTGVLASRILDEFTKTTCKGIIREAKNAGNHVTRRIY